MLTINTGVQQMEKGWRITEMLLVAETCLLVPVFPSEADLKGDHFFHLHSRHMVPYCHT